MLYILAAGAEETKYRRGLSVSDSANRYPRQRATSLILCCQIAMPALVHVSL